MHTPSLPTYDHWYHSGWSYHHYCSYYLTGVLASTLALPYFVFIIAMHFVEYVIFFHSPSQNNSSGFLFYQDWEVKTFIMSYKVLHDMPGPHSSLVSSLFIYPQVILLQPCWPPCYSSNKLGMLPPLGLCISNFLCLEYFSLKYPHGAKWSGNP